MEPAKRVLPLEGLSALTELVEVARETFLAHDVESTKRQRLRTYREPEVARIKASAKELRNYLNLEFAARRSIYEGLFARLDRALDEGNNEALHEVVFGIGDLAKTSQLAALGDLSQLRAACDDPNQVGAETPARTRYGGPPHAALVPSFVGPPTTQESLRQTGPIARRLS